MAADDGFGRPLDPAPYEPVPAGYLPLASGDESVLAASGLNSRPPRPARRVNKKAAIALGVALLGGGIGVMAVAPLRGSGDAAPAVTAAASASASSSPASTSPPEPSVAPAAPPKPSPKPKPVAPKPIAGTAEKVNKFNSRTLGQPYTVTVPSGWKLARGIRSDRAINLDMRMRNKAKTHSFAVMTVKPAVASGPVTADSLAAIRKALLAGEPGAKALAGTPKSEVAGATGIGYDVSTKSAGSAITMRTIVWRHGTTTYAAIWRAPGASFARSVVTMNQLLASLKYAP